MQSPAPAQQLRVSRYDRAASMLLALLTVVGSAVVVLLMVWLTNRILVPQMAVPVQLAEIDTSVGTGEGPLGDGQTLAGPIDQPIGVPEPVVQEKITAIADAVLAKEAILDDPALVDRPNSPVRNPLGRGGGYGGTGTGGGGKPRGWEVYFRKGDTLDSYARQLDFFGIELGVLMPNNQLTCVSALSRPKPTVRTVAADAEKRYYLTWRTGELQQADHELLARAGVQSQGRIILKLLPPAVEAKLWALEKANAGRNAALVRKTRFGVQPDGSGGYAFYVMEQRLR
jgi:hypothetical protein